MLSVEQGGVLQNLAIRVAAPDTSRENTCRAWLMNMSSVTCSLTVLSSFIGARAVRLRCSQTGTWCIDVFARLRGGNGGGERGVL